MSENLFKTFSTKQYEDAIKEALEKLTGEPLSVSIENITFERLGNFKDTDSLSVSGLTVSKTLKINEDGSF